MYLEYTGRLTRLVSAFGSHWCFCMLWSRTARLSCAKISSSSCFGFPDVFGLNKSCVNCSWNIENTRTVLLFNKNCYNFRTRDKEQTWSVSMPTSTHFLGSFLSAHDRSLISTVVLNALHDVKQQKHFLVNLAASMSWQIITLGR